MSKQVSRILSILILMDIFICQGNAQTNLTPGDIAVIAIKTSAGTDPGTDAVKLLTLVDLACNTKFIITDNNWRTTGTWYCNNDEFAIEVTVNSRIVAGSVIYIDVDNSGGIITSSTGSASKVSLGGDWGTNFGLNSGGDNVIILQGDRINPSFIFALRHNGTFTSGGDCVSKDNTALPTGLSLGTSAIQMPSTSNQWHYNCIGSITAGTKASLRTAISNVTNWTNSAGQSWNTNSCFFSVSDQFPISGVLAVSGPGCGCLSGCNLNALGGVNCSPSVAGDCSSGYQTMTRDITVPAGCTYTVYATMRPWLGCGSSGGDGGITGDQLKVDIPSGSKSNQTGSSNASLNDNFTLIGPGVIRISGRSNRADEIIVYKTVTSETTSSCSACAIPLPVEFIDFTVENEKNSAVLDWVTASEQNSSHFLVERSQNGLVWEYFSMIPASGNSTETIAYRLYDLSPLNGVSYYRLTQFDQDGEYVVLAIRSLIRDFNRKVIRCVNLFGQAIDCQSEGHVILHYDNGEIERTYH